MADNEYLKQCMCTTPEYTIELNKQGPPGIQGEPGKDGFSSKITVSQEDNTTYILKIHTPDGDILTPNLQGYGVPKDGVEGQYLVKGAGENLTEWIDLPIATINTRGTLRLATELDMEERATDSAITPAILAETIDNLHLKDIQEATSYGIKGDYSTHYGILDTPNGIVEYSATGLAITVQPGLVLQMAGATTKTINASELNYILTSTDDCVLFYAEGGSLIEATEVYYSTVEPEASDIGFVAWYSPIVGKWQFKSDDTGNVWREAVATPIANIRITNGNITRLDYIGYRILDDELLVSKDMYDALLARVTALETEINGGNA